MTETPADTIRRAARLFRDTAEGDGPQSRRVVLASIAQVQSLAEVFDAVAAEMSDYGSVIEDTEGVKVAPSHGFRYDAAPLWTTALTAARAILGETP